MDNTGGEIEGIESFGQLWIGADGCLRGLLSSDNGYPRPEVHPAGWTVARVQTVSSPDHANGGSSVQRVARRLQMTTSQISSVDLAD
ncbi:MAG: hypothetical protein KF883_09490 [Thermomicrobiales bacterium]|nr:hypothetical protein [Thermomicrobiales bacterium]